MRGNNCMKKEILKFMIEDILETAKELLVKEGRLRPVAFVSHDDEIEVKPLSFKDNEEKISQLSILKDFVKEKNADAVFILTESWYVETNQGHLTVSPSKDPRRKECIMIIGECEEGDISMVQIFGREDGKENGKIVFGKKIDMEGTISSRFNFGIKDRNKKHINKFVRDLN